MTQWEKERRGILYFNEAADFFAERCRKIEQSFLRDFYGQCIESTRIDGLEMMENHTALNPFFRSASGFSGPDVMDFFRLSAIHHTICLLLERRKGIKKDVFFAAMAEIFALSRKERELAEVLWKIAWLDKNSFIRIFSAISTNVFSFCDISTFSVAFWQNFWYNAYSVLMEAFTLYVPFSVRLERGCMRDEQETA